MKRLSTEEFIRISKDMHGDDYSYSKSVYIKSKIKLTVTCYVHGDFEVFPNDHMRGIDCRKCSLINRRKRQPDTTSIFVTKSKIIHGDKYDYSKVKYLGDKIPVTVICRKHGEFSVRPRSHIDGFSGCSQCEKCGYKKTKQGTLYVLRTENITKVGITNRLVDKRIEQINRSSRKNFCIVEAFSLEDGNRIFEIEKELLKYLKSFYSNPKDKFDGYTECFLDVDHKNLTMMISELRRK